jgi:Spy/CpxP family protein refolding chaperone
MTRFSTSGRVLTGLLVLAFAGAVGAQSFKWWESEQFRKGLGLTAEQSNRIEAVFQATLPKLQEFKKELDRQDADLSRLIENNADEAQVAQQVDRVEGIRSSLNKMRTLMLLRMRQALSSDQRVRFKVLHEQWERDHRKNHGASGNP